MSKSITVNDETANLQTIVHTGDEIYIPDEDAKVNIYRAIVMRKSLMKTTF